MGKILYPPQRPGEKPELWAPHLMKYEGKYNVIYSPQEMRRVVSCDFESWEQAPVLFRCTDPAARDPFIYEEEGKFYCLYIEDRYLKYRVSDNMAEIGAGADVIYFGDFSGLALKQKANALEMQVLREKYATQHATGITAWVEFDAKVEHKQKIAKVKMGA